MKPEDKNINPDLQEAYEELRKMQNEYDQICLPIIKKRDAANRKVLDLEKEVHKELYQSIHGRIFYQQWTVRGDTITKIYTPIKCEDFHEYNSCQIRFFMVTKMDGKINSLSIESGVDTRRVSLIIEGLRDGSIQELAPGVIPKDFLEYANQLIEETLIEVVSSQK